MHPSRSSASTPIFSLSGIAAALALLAGCASLPNAPGAQAATASHETPKPAAAASAPHGAASAPGQAQAPASGPPPFATVIKDAKKIDGLLSLWQKDEKVWFELKPEDFGKPMFLSPKLASGIGEPGLFGGSMEEPQMVEFRRVHNQVQLIALNTDFVARKGTPEGRAVAAAYSPSLLGSAMVASQPHPERKTVLVEANAFFVSDMLGVASRLQRSYRQGYNFDGRNSAIVQVRAKPDLVVFEVQNHYMTNSIAVPQANTPPGVPQPTTPHSLPDARSLFMTLHYSLAKLPDDVMAPRRADPRVGYFTTSVNDFSDDLARTPKVRYVNRWRLEKKDPAAELSEPVKPITYWLDRTVPLKYRDAISAGILEWNKAFEKIGFKNAIVVKVQPEDADFDTLDANVASVRWMTNSTPAFGAIGPSHVDPRSGEILDADIGIESLSSRNLRATRAQILSPKDSDWNALLQVGIGAADGAAHSHDARLCTHADTAAEQLTYALDVLSARGDVDPSGPEAEAFVLAYLKDVTMHEVGHTLGLRHNFRASRIYTDAQLSDPEFTRTHALTGSVMEYAPVNLARPGDKAVAPFQTTLGPYDYWAIEYAYKPVAHDHEAAELAKVAARSAEPELAFGTDEDNFLGIDPDALHMDLGNDAIGFAKKRLAIAHDLFKRQETRTLSASEDYTVLRRSLNYAVRDVGRASGILLRQIGGLRTLRDFPGSGRDPLQPVSPAAQREALDALAKGLLAADSFVVSPALQRRLAPDFQERSDALFSGEASVSTDFSLTQTVVELQRALLAQLMSDGVATRILDSQGKASKREDAFQLSELYGRLERDVWSELQAKGDIPASRRELQREYVNRLSGLLLRPGASSRADARALLRQQAQGLLAHIQGAARRGDLSAEARAHLADSADTLSQALSARLQRAGV